MILNKRMAALESAAEKTARILVRRPDVRVVIGKSAKYDWTRKVLYVPEYSSRPDDPELVAAWRGLLDHECGHVEFTDFEVLEKHRDDWIATYGHDVTKRIFSVANCFEDIWMERAWAELFPGSADHLIAQHSYVFRTTGGAKATDPDYEVGEGKGKIGQWGAFTQGIVRVGLGMMRPEEVFPGTAILMSIASEAILQGYGASSTEEACVAARAVWDALAGLVSEAGEEEDEGEGEGEGEEGEESGEAEPGEADEAELDEAESDDKLGDYEHRELVAEATGGDWGEVPPGNEVVGNAYIDALPPQYTIHPAAAAYDKVIRYADKRAALALRSLEEAAGPAIQKLIAYCRGAFAASRQSLVIGGMEEGDELDECALPGIAMGSNDKDIFTTTIRKIEETAFVQILVDVSGSMGSSGLRDGRGRLGSKAAYAALTATAIHKALVGIRVPHSVLGYSTTPTGPSVPNSRLASGYKEWSRSSSGLEMHEFVPAPGIYDDGAALPYITGRHGNLDGESLLWAAKYAARHGGSSDRVIIMVIADGLPAGADCSKIESAYLKEVVEMVAHAGIEVYGIGVCLHSFEVFKRLYPDHPGSSGRASTGAIEIRSEEGLTERVIRELTALLTRGLGRRT